MPKKKTAAPVEAPELNDHSARAHALLSASSSSRWLACPPSAVLAARYPNPDTIFTREGTLAHEVAEAVASGRDCKAIEGVTDEMIRHATDYAAYIDGLTQPGTSRMLETRVDFSPWVPGGFGTADCILLTGDVMDVIDFKYGQGVAVSAENNTQMMLYGLGAMNDYGFIYDVRVVRLHIFQPRMGNLSVFETTAAHLLDWGESYVKPRAALAAEGRGQFRAGDNCRFCPHAGLCPELARRCLDVVRGAPPVDTLTPADVARVLGLEPMISHWLKKVGEAARTALLNGDEIPGYKIVEGKLGNRKWSDELAVAAALDAAGVSRDDYTTVSLLSPAEMDKALGKKRAAELLAGLITRAPGAPTVVPVTDKRAPLDRLAEAVNDFKN